MINNPIIHREFVGVLRTKTALAALCGVAIFFTALIILRWPTDALVDMSGAQSQGVFRMFGYGLMTAILLLVPVFPATSFVRERKQGTLVLLLNSPMNAVAIYSGKLVAFVSFFGLLMFMIVPAAAACYAMGGISITADVAMLYLLLGIAALQCTTMALLVSTYAASTDSALRIAYGCVLGFAILTLGPNFFLQGKGTALAQAADWLRCASPLPAVMELMRQEGVGSKGLISSTTILGRFLLISLISSVGCSVWSVIRLNHRILDRSRSQGVITNERSSSMQWLRRLVYLVDPQRRKGGIGFFVNPVMVKEFRCRRFGRMHWMLRLAAVSAVISLGLTLASTMGATDWGAESIGGVMVLLQAALIVLITPSLSAGLISSEVESGGWPLLQMTPLSAIRIMSGKLSSVIWPVLLILTSTLPGYLVMYWIEPDMWLTIRQVLICLGVTATFTIALSIAVSSMFKRTAVATTVSYSLLSLICAGTMLIWILRDAPFGHATVETALMLNPIAAALHIIGTPGFTEYALVPGNWWIIGTATVVCFVVTLVQLQRLARPQ